MEFLCGPKTSPNHRLRISRREEDYADIGDGDAADLLPHHLSSWQSAKHGVVDEREVNRIASPLATSWPGMNFVNPDELVSGHIIKHDSKAAARPPCLLYGCVRANACKDIWWNPAEVTAAIVTCGGLCPGLNSIIREVTNCLWDNYGIRRILGMQCGYEGLSNPEENPPIELNPHVVCEIHMQGGSILKAGRGGFDPKVICDQLEKQGINMLFTVGGDGTQHAAYLLFEAAKERGLAVSIVGVPKSIDNDIVLFDRTFGFDSAVAKASLIIRNAWVEATSQERGVGIVKLMGRDAGFVSMDAALASTIVDLVLIPEVPFKIEDVLAHIDATLALKNYMVIALAEGAGQEHVSTGEKDATGHAKYGDIGVFLKDIVGEHLKSKGSGEAPSRLKVTIKSARGLRDEDTYMINGKSDPYCTCSIKGREAPEFTTKVVNDTLAPEWNEETELQGVGPDCTLVFEVLDDDGVSATSLGRAALTMQQLRGGFDGELELQDAGKGAKAFLTVSVVADGAQQNEGRCIYIDPSYIIRSCPVTPNDHIYCARLARDAVHTALRGYSGVCVGALHNIIVAVPSKLIANAKKRVKVQSSAWQSCIQACKMPYNLTGLQEL